MTSKREVVGTLRNRILRGLQAGTLRHGDRLSSARELAAEFQLDYRQVLSAFKALEAEGLVQVRERGGAYVTSHHAVSGLPLIQPSWLVEVLVEAFGRQLSPSIFAEWLSRSIYTVQLHAVLISTDELTLGELKAELETDFGIIVHEMNASMFLEYSSGMPVNRSDLLLVTPDAVELVRGRADELSKPWIVIESTPFATEADWRALLKTPLWAVVASRPLGDLLRQALSGIPESENLHVVVFGKEDLHTIPEGAPTYVTSRLRDELMNSSCKGRILPAARTITVDSARRILTIMVDANLKAAGAMSRYPLGRAGNGT